MKKEPNRWAQKPTLLNKLLSVCIEQPLVLFPWSSFLCLKSIPGSRSTKQSQENTPVRGMNCCMNARMRRDLSLKKKAMDRESPKLSQGNAMGGKKSVNTRPRWPGDQLATRPHRCQAPKVNGAHPSQVHTQTPRRAPRLIRSDLNLLCVLLQARIPEYAL